jgi:hypothetical protein
MPSRRGSDIEVSDAISDSRSYEAQREVAAEKQSVVTVLHALHVSGLVGSL